MKTNFEKLFKEWSGNDRYNCRELYDSSEMIEFAKYCSDKSKSSCAGVSLGDSQPVQTAGKFEDKICCYNCKHFDNSEIVDEMPIEICNHPDFQFNIILPGRHYCAEFKRNDSSLSN